MKNRKLLTIILSSLLISTTISAVPTYAEDSLSVQSEVDTNSSLFTDLNLGSLKIDKKIVKPGDTVTVSLKKTDKNSDISYIDILFKKSNYFITMSYNSETGNYEGSFQIKANMQETMSVDKLLVSYTNGHSTTIQSSDYDFSNISFKIDNYNHDHTAPTVDFVKVNTKKIKPGKTITVSVKASDDNAGVGSISVDYISPNKSKKKFLFLTYNEKTKFYEGKLKIDSYMETGTWSIDSISVSDNAYNSATLNASDYDFSNASFKVVNKNEDITVPTIDFVKVDKKIINPGEPSSVNVSVKASDDNSGIDSIFMYYLSKTTLRMKSVSLHYNYKTKLYEGTLDLDTNKDIDTWSIYQVYIYDKANNSHTCEPSNFDFSDASFEVKSKDDEVITPSIELDTLKINKKTFKPGDTITISMKGSKSRSDITFMDMLFTNKNKFMPLIYNYETGNYEGSLTVDEKMQSGTWTVDKIMIGHEFGLTNYIKSSDYDFSNISFNIVSNN